MNNIMAKQPKKFGKPTTKIPLELHAAFIAKCKTQGTDQTNRLKFLIELDLSGEIDKFLVNPSS